MRAQFDKIDGNGDGSLSKNELKVMLKKLRVNYSEDAVNELIDAADENGDG